MKSLTHWLRIGIALSSVLWTMAIGLNSACARADNGVDLRGYGKVTASITPERSEFTCENNAKADILLGKLLADMFWDAGQNHVVKTVALGGRKVVVHEWQPYGDVIVARSENCVLVIGGGDEQHVLNRASSEPLLKSANTLFKPVRPYPMYLDWYDLKSVKCGSYGLHPMNKFRYKEGSAFIKKFCDGGVISGMRFGASLEDGVDPQFDAVDSAMVLAKKYDYMVSMAMSIGTWPAWARDKWPNYVDQPSPVHFEAPSGYGAPEALGLSPEDRRQSSLKYFGDFVKRFANNPLTGSWELYTGDGIFETCFYRWNQGHLGFSDIGEAAFRNWLRTAQGYSLADLGTRWYGDPNHFKSWSEVTLKDPDEFFGDYNSDCLPIQNSWLCKEEDTPPTASPAVDDQGWIPVPTLPNQQMAALPHVPMAWRATFDASSWLQKNSGKDVYLVLNPDDGWWRSTEVWLNGTDLGSQKSTTNPFYGPIALKVTGLIKNGDNQLCFYVNKQVVGAPIGLTFLTTTEPKAYPYLGKYMNAQWVDMMEWRLDALNSKVDDAASYVRSVSPDKPIIMCATNGDVKDGQGELLREYGGSMQDTGYESSFRPFNSRMGYVDGFYGSCEPSGTADVANPDPTNFITTSNRRLGWTLFNAEGSYKELSDPTFYLAFEKKTGWFTKNMRLYQLIGKFLPEKPGVAILGSSINPLLGDEFYGGAWDIGRGEIEASHYDNVYITDTMLKQGLANDYPVLFDPGNAIMVQPTIDAIRKYVEQGGTFIATQNSGRDSLLEGDSWPISQLTGFKVLQLAKKGDIKFGNNLPVFKGWEGREFEGEGSSLDFKDVQWATNVSVGLAPAAADTVALAKWDDGSVAVGMRKLGKGRVIVLGSTFWRNGRDVGGTGMWRTGKVEPEFLERLFTDLGVNRTADASTPDVFAREMITKNGLQESLIAINTTNANVTADLGFATSKQPEAVWDMNDNSPVPFTYTDGWVRIKDAALTPYGTRIFATKRGTLSEGVDFWWGEKTKFWTRRKTVAPLVQPSTNPASPPPTISLEAWKFFPDRDGTIGNTNGWLMPSYNDAAWRSANNTPWNLQFDDLVDYGGVGLYRSLPFAIPANWKGKPITINMDGYLGACWTSIDVYVNGVKIDALLHPRLKIDVTSYLKRKGNVVCVKLAGRPITGDYPLSGIEGSAIWLQPEQILTPFQSLLGEWQAVQADWVTQQPVTLLGVNTSLTDDGRVKNGVQAVTANHLVRSVNIPSAWEGRSVYLHLVSPSMTSSKTQPISGLPGGMLMVNGHILLFAGWPNRPFDETLNLTPYITFGKANQIEIWPVGPARGSTVADNIVINNMTIGCGAMDGRANGEIEQARQ